MSLRKKIIDSERYARAVTGAFSGYLRFAYSSSKWQRLGFESMDEVVKNGDTVIMVTWHQRVMLTQHLFDVSLGKCCALTSSSRAGNMMGKFLQRFGIDYLPISSFSPDRATSRTVLKNMRNGYSLAIAADGSRGPARQSSNVPLVWGRVSEKRIFAVSYSSRRAFRLPTWDRMMFPMPFTSGVLMCQEWTQTIPRKATDTEFEALRLDLQKLLDEVLDSCDLATGRKQ